MKSLKIYALSFIPLFLLSTCPLPVRTDSFHDALVEHEKKGENITTSRHITISSEHAITIKQSRSKRMRYTTRQGARAGAKIGAIIGTIIGTITAFTNTIPLVSTSILAIHMPLLLIPIAFQIAFTAAYGAALGAAGGALVVNVMNKNNHAHSTNSIEIS